MVDTRFQAIDNRFQAYEERFNDVITHQARSDETARITATELKGEITEVKKDVADIREILISIQKTLGDREKEKSKEGDAIPLNSKDAGSILGAPPSMEKGSKSTPDKGNPERGTPDQQLHREDFDLIMAEEENQIEMKEEGADIAPFDPTKKKKKVVIQDPADDPVEQLTEKTESLSDELIAGTNGETTTQGLDGLGAALGEGAAEYLHVKDYTYLGCDLAAACSSRECIPPEAFCAKTLKNAIISGFIQFLNSSSEDDLKMLKGIGPLNARSIIELREKSLIKKLEDLKCIPMHESEIKRLLKSFVLGIVD